MTNLNAPYGRIEIAELLDVDKRTPHAWMNRGVLPAPDFEHVNGSPAWLGSTIIAWAARTGRLPEYLRPVAEAAGYEIYEAGRGGRVAKAEHGAPREDA